MEASRAPLNQYLHALLGTQGKGSSLVKVLPVVKLGRFVAAVVQEHGEGHRRRCWVEFTVHALGVDLREVEEYELRRAWLWFRMVKW